MMEFLRFTFENWRHFFGVVVLVSLVTRFLVNFVKAIRG